MKIVKQEEQPLLSRKEIIAEVFFEKQTPSEKEVKAQLASSLKAKENLLVIKSVLQEFGAKKAKVIAYLYDNEEQLKIIEPKLKKPKGKEKTTEEKTEPKEI